MIKKTISYTSFDGEELSEEFHFHLNRSDLITMEMSFPGGLKAHLEQIIEAEDGGAIMKQMKALIENSYGKKSPDGKRFVKNDQLVEEFVSSPAYDVLFVELCTDAGAAGDFVNGIVPAGLDNDPQLKKIREGTPDGPPPGFEQRVKDSATGEHLTVEPEPVGHPSDTAAQPLGTAAQVPRRLTQQEVIEMDSEELKDLLASGNAVIGEG